MNPDSVANIISQALLAAFWLGAPLLLIGFAVGILINLVQIATSLQDSAFSTIPRLAAFLAGILLLLPWMLKRMITYTISIFGDFHRFLS
ncbi:MAG: flagellar biosynthetic protein FliQ [Acidobacteria bacterium]|nr:flagellar biosynthetic protein FliQ [Acidobacteriota bacterium]